MPYIRFVSGLAENFNRSFSTRTLRNLRLQMDVRSCREQILGTISREAAGAQSEIPPTITDALSRGAPRNLVLCC